MDLLPSELVLCILDYSDMMSQLMLSMTCKRINKIYIKNNYVSSKDIRLDVVKEIILENHIVMELDHRGSSLRLISKYVIVLILY